LLEKLEKLVYLIKPN